MVKKHILFLSYHLPMDDEPGAFRPWMEARLMSRAGFKVTVITSGVQYMTGKDIRPGKGWCTEEERESIRILRTWAPTDHRRSLIRRVANYLSYTVLMGIAAFSKVGRVNGVFAGTDPIFMMPMVYIVSRIKRAMLVLDERDLFPETAIALGVIQEGFLSGFLFKMQQFFRRKSCALVAATPGIRSKLIDYGHPQVNLLYNGDVFLEKPPHGQRTLRKETGKAFLVGYAGGLGQANDIPTLLRAAIHLQDIEELGIVIIGSGERRSAYEKFCANLNNIYFFDAVPRHEARQLMGQFDVGIQPLPKDKHFCSTLTSKTFDYHGIGIAMIFCGSGDTAKILAASGGGLTITPEDDKALADALRGLYKDKEQLKAMGESARRWFEQHLNIQAGIALFAKVFESQADDQSQQLL
jgi:glycosyltransferase involved in cell wall biosynthesis